MRNAKILSIAMALVLVMGATAGCSGDDGGSSLVKPNPAMKDRFNRKGGGTTPPGAPPQTGTPAAGTTK